MESNAWHGQIVASSYLGGPAGTFLAAKKVLELTVSSFGHGINPQTNEKHYLADDVAVSPPGNLY